MTFGHHPAVQPAPFRVIKLSSSQRREKGKTVLPRLRDADSWERGKSLRLGVHNNLRVLHIGFEGIVRFEADGDAGANLLNLKCARPDSNGRPFAS
jgi:hypothetical protein